MRLYNARVYRDGRFVPGGLDFDTNIRGFDGEGGKDAHGAYIIPGLIDVHTHGAVGADASDGDAEGLKKLSEYYAANGVTSFCPTTMTLKEPELICAAQCVRDFVRPERGSQIAGIHLEGPFISYAKRGAQNPDNLHAPDFDMFQRINDSSGGQVRLITVAPEIDGALDFIRRASGVCTVSLGHSTADYDQAMAGFDAGATHATHLFNGMEPLHHRKPGLVGAALTAGASVELICDGFHIHPAVVNAVHRMFGRKLVIISDSLRCAGMPDGEYELGGQPIIVRGGKATLFDGTIAGSSTNLMQELRNVVSFGIALEDAVYALTEAPARSIGCFDTIGSLAEGKRADFLIVGEKLDLQAVFVGGERIK